MAEPVVSVPGKPGGTVQRRDAILLLSAATLLLFWGLGWRSLWAAEGRWAEVTREMLLTGDFFHPTIGGEPYFDKPLLTYWLRAIISVATGMLNELVVRLPSAISGIVAVWATVRVGTRLWSARTGRIAGWFLLTTYAFVFWARTGTADAENLAVIILAVAWYWSRRDRLNFPAMLVFYLIVFIGALTKGLTAVVVPLLVVLPDFLVERRWRLLLRPGHFLAFAIGSLLYLSTFVYASFTQPSSYQSSGLGLVFQENILRYFRPIDHRGPIYLYVYGLPLLLLPWTPLFLMAVAGVVEGWKGLDRHTRWLVWAIILMFLFFTFSGSRRSYYILPILPFCSLLMAVFVGWLRQPRLDGLRQRGLGIQKVMFTGLIAFELAIPLILIISRRVIDFEAPLSFHVAGLVVGLIAALAAWIFARIARGPTSPEGTNEAVWPQIAVAVVLLGGYFFWQQDILEINRTERPFARQLQARITGSSPMRIGIFPKSSANILFYLDSERPVEVLRDPDQLRRFTDEEYPGVLITQQRYAAGLPAEITAKLQTQQSLHEDVRSWESRSSKKEKWVAWFWETPADAGGMMEVKEGVEDAK